MLWNYGTLCKFHSVNFLTPVRQIERYHRHNYFSRCYSKRATRLSARRCRNVVRKITTVQPNRFATCRCRHIVFVKGVKGRSRRFRRAKVITNKKRGDCARSLLTDGEKQIPRRYFSFPSEKEKRCVSLQSIYPSGCHQYRTNVDRLLRPDSRNTNGAAILP